MHRRRLLAVHLLNDFSGSPFVLRQALEVMVKDDYEVHLFTSTPGEKGFLSDIGGVEMHPLPYRWSGNKLLTLFYFLFSQLYLFVQILLFARNTDTIYINSILPFGAGMAARLRGCRLIYHIHEVSIRPALLRQWLLFVIRQCADQVIFVSVDLQQRTPMNVPYQVIYNSLPEDFIQKANDRETEAKKEPFTILMVCSLKKYKGLMEFVACARNLQRYRFILVLNASREEIDSFFSGESLPGNLILYPAQSNVHPSYREADIVVNMSVPDQWIETFGMTILEAMYYKKPVIVPPVGGISEWVEEGLCGYKADSRETEKVCRLISGMEQDSALYRQMSNHAYQKAQMFSPDQFSSRILGILRQ